MSMREMRRRLTAILNMPMEELLLELELPDAKEGKEEILKDCRNNVALAFRLFPGHRIPSPRPTVREVLFGPIADSVRLDHEAWGPEEDEDRKGGDYNIEKNEIFLWSRNFLTWLAALNTLEASSPQAASLETARKNFMRTKEVLAPICEEFDRIAESNPSGTKWGAMLGSPELMSWTGASICLDAVQTALEPLIAQARGDFRPSPPGSTC